MTLAGQYLLLQVLIVLVVLRRRRRHLDRPVRPHLRAQRDAAGAERGREPRRPTRRCAQRLGRAEPGRRRPRRPRRESIAHPVRRPRRCASPAPDGTRAGLLRPDPGRAPGDARRRAEVPGGRVVDRRREQSAGARVVVGPGPGLRRRRRVVGVAAVGRRRAVGLEPARRRGRPTCCVYLGVASAARARRLAAARPAGSSARRSAWSPPRSPAWSSTARRCCTASRRAWSRSTATSRVTLVNDSARQLLRPAGGLRRPPARRARPRPAGRRGADRRADADGPDRLGRWSATGCWPSTVGRCVRSGTVIGSVTTLRDRTELSALRARARHAAARPATPCARRPTSSPTSCTRSPACCSSGSTTRCVRFVDGVTGGRTALYDEVTSRVARRRRWRRC